MRPSWYSSSLHIRNSQAKAVDGVLTRSPAEKLRTDQEILEEVKRLKGQSCADNIRIPTNKRHTNERIIENSYS
ncbi:hypothetical protein F4813DRAFT_343904 [Daldinia decipiens]|uniref:uncharacterized protein n=1 Tax=Daldinia decipiens TaxID=326647 RepID=UPI0020C20645|nr:uncharacterized protein F4813DRAFT_343904 [Daldinia decipiens]KAI1662224.1 hypothetical protein F4813DRAFT_343904 [Daldinia decipiens]